MQDQSPEASPFLGTERILPRTEMILVVRVTPYETTYHRLHNIGEKGFNIINAYGLSGWSPLLGLK